MTFQLTPAGLETDSQEEVFQDLAGRVQAALGTNINVTATSQIGQLLNILSEFYALTQQNTKQLYDSLDPDAAVGLTLDQRAALVGTKRRGETFSIVVGEVTASGAINIPNGSLIENVDTTTQWELISGPIVEAGAGVYPATFQAVTAGPVTALAGTTWNIVTPSANWVGYANPIQDATPGQLEETDSALRKRRDTEIYGLNPGPLNAIAAVVSKVNTANGFVDRVAVYHNPQVQPVDTNGIPFKAYNAVVQTVPPIDPFDLPPTVALQGDILDALLRATGAGGEPFGTDVAGVSTDVEGQVQPVSFDIFRTTDVIMRIFIETPITTGSDNYPIVPVDPQQMADLIRPYVVQRALEDLTGIGEDVLAYSLKAFVSELTSVQSVRGIDTLDILISDGGPFTNLLVVPIRNIPDFDTGNVSLQIDGVLY